MRFKKLQLNDYKQFKGKHAFEFSDRITLIMGEGASGKTIIFNALKQSLTEEIPGVELELEGNKKDFNEYLEYIFINEETLRKKAKEGQSHYFCQTNFLYGPDYFSALVIDLTIRAHIKKDLPLVIEADIFSLLDREERMKIYGMIKAMKEQVIVFHHWDGIKPLKGDKEYML